MKVKVKQTLNLNLNRFAVDSQNAYLIAMFL